MKYQTYFISLFEQKLIEIKQNNILISD